MNLTFFDCKSTAILELAYIFRHVLRSGLDGVISAFHNGIARSLDAQMLSSYWCELILGDYRLSAIVSN